MKIIKEGNILFNDTLNTFYLWLYGVQIIQKRFLKNEVEVLSFCIPVFEAFDFLYFSPIQLSTVQRTANKGFLCKHKQSKQIYI